MVQAMPASCHWRAIRRSLLGALSEEIWITDTVGMADVLQTACTRTENFADPRTRKKKERRRASPFQHTNQLADYPGIFRVKGSPGMVFARNYREAFAFQSGGRQAEEFGFTVAQPLGALAGLDIFISETN
jgi:hypothetical protein